MGSHPQSSDSVGLEWGPTICILSKFPGAAKAAGEGHTLKATGTPVNRFHNFTVLSLWLPSLETLCHSLFSKFQREIQI